jgi:hypothetical protein
MKIKVIRDTETLRYAAEELLKYLKMMTPEIDGEIVVAMVEDEFSDGWSATLKRFYRDMKNNRYILHPENAALDDIIVDKVHVVGVAVRVLKNLESIKRRFC